MTRIASHYIYYDVPYRMHYIELDEVNCIKGVYPFKEELAMTTFVNGIIFPILEAKANTAEEISLELIRLQTENPTASIFDLLEQIPSVAKSKDNEPVVLFKLNSCNLSSPKFSTDNRGSNGYIERL